MDFVSPIVYIIIVVNIFINGESVNQVNIANAINVAIDSVGITQTINQGQANQYGTTPWAQGNGGTVNQYNYGSANNYAGDSVAVSQAIGQTESNAVGSIGRPRSN